MFDPPAHLGDAEVLEIVCREWSPQVRQVEHLPVGFGAHHWRAATGDGPDLFVTFDTYAARHTPGSLEAAYAGAAALADQGLDFVLPSVRARSGKFTVSAADGAISVTPWLDGHRPVDECATPALLDRLHRAAPPRGLPVWAPLTSPSFPDELADRLGSPWDSGPHGAQVRAALTSRLRDIAAWNDRYLALAAESDPAHFVPTHGEPGVRNQLQAEGHVWLVDWESLKLAPADRDARPSPELFDLEWRLDEIGQYATWFEGVHSDSRSDRVALDGLLAELAR